MLYSDKIAVRNLVEICVTKGIEQVVLSPGSRNAPFSITFNRHPQVKTTVIVDERSAAFYALGLAQQSRKTVALVCTSGTAVLNYAPAIAEAFYQKIPLLVITADRPAEWIDQMDGQTIRQENIYSNYIKKSFNIPTEPTNEEEVWHAARICSEAIETTNYPENGPVHINFPLREPLYGIKDYSNFPAPQIFETIGTKLELSLSDVGQLQKKWRKYRRILIVTGLLNYDSKLSEALSEIALQTQVAVLTETTSNLFGQQFNRSIDRLLVGIEDKNEDAYQPELLVTLGGPVVSKKIKAFLRKQKKLEHWHINASNDFTDTYQHLSTIIPVDPAKLLVHFKGLSNPESSYNQTWRNLDNKLLQVFRKFIEGVEFSDLKVFNRILSVIPQKSHLQLGNSTVVRYSNLFDQIAAREIHCYSNRGTSGIDGTISTAFGAAANSDKITTVITGDLSFFYDSNALMIRPLPENLRIIVINNQGGNIFRIIDGPKQIPELENYFEAKHDFKAEYIAKAFQIPYLSCSNEAELERALAHIYNPSQAKCCLVEIHTPNDLTPEILKDYFRQLKIG